MYSLGQIEPCWPGKARDTSDQLLLVFLLRTYGTVLAWLGSLNCWSFYDEIHGLLFGALHGIPMSIPLKQRISHFGWCRSKPYGRLSPLCSGCLQLVVNPVDDGGFYLAGRLQALSAAAAAQHKSFLQASTSRVEAVKVLQQMSRCPVFGCGRVQE